MKVFGSGTDLLCGTHGVGWGGVGAMTNGLSGDGVFDCAFR